MNGGQNVKVYIAVVILLITLFGVFIPLTLIFSGEYPKIGTFETLDFFYSMVAQLTDFQIEIFFYSRYFSVIKVGVMILYVRLLIQGGESNSEGLP